ncbi:MAG: class I SAM-dependent methyltransferase [Verrucomicrobia bacterium]|nr:class I SAM-dependent methyltransferase [Verrucomicrobiota bacterium]MCF7707682.1 class I SAM-dependent methyltransferase [Verrucomicrobiota bacterium]
MNSSTPCVIYEDAHLLVVRKPPGLNTHAADPFKPEGVYDWIRNREAHWAGIGIVHRLDKETSGVLVFPKTALAKKSLTEQFAGRRVKKEYLFLTDRNPSGLPSTMCTGIVRKGEVYAVKRTPAKSEEAITTFFSAEKRGAMFLVRAEPLTGKTHQVRVHAAAAGIPVLGDTRYGGTSADRIYLHAAELKFQHPSSGEEVCFSLPQDFEGLPWMSLREAVISPELTGAYRLFNGESVEFTGWNIDRFGEYALSEAESALTSRQHEVLERIRRELSLKGIYHKTLLKHVRRTDSEDASPECVLGEAAPDSWVVKENALKFRISFSAGYSTGLFLDQRDNRRRLLEGHVAAGFPPIEYTDGAEVLNTFAYTCGFSVCAAKAGALVTSVDLSKKYLDWGRANFIANDLNPERHQFLYGDVFDWIKRLFKKGSRFNVVILDPPTFSTSKKTGVFRAEKDYGRLVRNVVRLLEPRGVVLASTNMVRMAPEKLLRHVRDGVAAEGRRIENEFFAPPPPDFPIGKKEPLPMKSFWLRIG